MAESGAVTEKESEGDLSSRTRAYLIREGLKLVEKKEYASADKLFGAAIRRAKMIGLWDIQAEFYKFVTLFRQKKYEAAMQRCLVCMERVNLFHEVAQMQGTELPRKILFDHLDQCMIACIVRKGEGVMAIAKHFRENSLAKKYGFFESMNRAREAATLNIRVDYDALKTELAPFSEYLRQRLYGSGMEKPSAADKVLDAGTEAVFGKAEAMERAVAEDRDAKFGEFLDGLSGREFSQLSSKQVDQLFAVCEGLSSARNFELVARILSFAGPDSRKAAAGHLARNAAVRSGVLKPEVPEAKLLLQEVADAIRN